MKLSTVILQVDDIKPNAFSSATKTAWLNECEGLVQTDVMLREIGEIVTYDYETDKDAELLVASPHSKIYAAYLLAKIDFANGEYEKYQNSMQVFNAYFAEYASWYADNYRPADGGKLLQPQEASCYLYASGRKNVTLSSVVGLVDDIKPNAFSSATKTAWLNECEGLVQTEVLLVQSDEIITYDYNTDADTELLVAVPHSKIYAAYLMAQIDFANGDYKKYKNTVEIFNAYMGEYMRWFAGNYRPADTHPDDYENETPGQIGKPWRGYYLSAYGLAVKHGYTGTEADWIASLKGKDGTEYEIGFGLELDKATNTLSTEIGNESFEEIPNTKVQEIFNKVMNG